MKNEIRLTKPLEIKGKAVKVLTYDTDKITAEQFFEADRLKANKQRGNNTVSAALAEFDNTLHFYIGAQAIIAENPDIDITDIERVHGADIFKIAGIGRGFFIEAATSAQSSSDELSEDTPASTTPTPQD